MHLIEGPAYARALLNADPGMVLNPRVLLGKHAKPKLSGKDLAKAQLAAWDNFLAAPSLDRKKKRPRS
jgi:hypothetical protein